MHMIRNFLGHIRCIYIMCTAGTWSAHNVYKRSQTGHLGAQLWVTQCVQLGNPLGIFVHFQAFPGVDTASVHSCTLFVHNCGQDNFQDVHDHFSI